MTPPMTNEECYALRAETPTEQKIASLPIRRDDIFRPTKGPIELRASKSYHPAIYAHLRGKEEESPCSHCRSGNGPFNSCVRVEVDGVYIFGGGCTNCRYKNHPNNCSFRKQAESIDLSIAAAEGAKHDGSSEPTLSEDVTTSSLPLTKVEPRDNAKTLGSRHSRKISVGRTTQVKPLVRPSPDPEVSLLNKIGRCLADPDAKFESVDEMTMVIQHLKTAREIMKGRCFKIKSKQKPKPTEARPRSNSVEGHANWDNQEERNEDAKYSINPGTPPTSSATILSTATPLRRRV